MAYGTFIHIDKISNMDVLLMQIRHIQYHVGHCNSILRDRGYRAVDWIEYCGDHRNLSSKSKGCQDCFVNA
jgi:hypothetical protein